MSQRIKFQTTALMMLSLLSIGACSGLAAVEGASTVFSGKTPVII